METQYIDFFEFGQQKFHLNMYDLELPPGDPVYTLIKVMEELNYAELLAQYSPKGRKGYNPIMLLAVLFYASMRGVRSVDQIVELCERDLGFLSLTKGQKPRRDTFYDFINNRLAGGLLEDLHVQFIRRLKDEGLITLEELFIDGTKIEANAGRYTFVWRGAINYHLAGLLDRLDDLYNLYNALIKDNGFDKKYELSTVQMFVIEGMDKVREAIEKNRARKKSGRKKRSNNIHIAIDHCSPLEILELQCHLRAIAEGEKMLFVWGKGQKKSELQRLYEDLEACGERLLKYKENFEILGEDRNSYAKTDIDATFMRMKDDHMMNGQLKPAYNIQIAVENYFIIHTHVSADRTDYNTLIPILEKHKETFDDYPSAVTADSGYSSEKNLLFLKENEIMSYIKLQQHEVMKTRAFQNDIGKFYNMTAMVDEDRPYYLCHDGRPLYYSHSEKRTQGDLTRTFEVYACADCDDCEHKARCLYRYDKKQDKHKNKVMKINETWEDLKAKSDANIHSEKGILNRQIRSIQTEGHFGDLKENQNIRRFNHRSTEKVTTELMLTVMGRNLMKYHRFTHGMIKKFKGKVTPKAA